MLFLRSYASLGVHVRGPIFAGWLAISAEIVPLNRSLRSENPYSLPDGAFAGAVDGTAMGHLPELTELRPNLPF